MKKNKELFFFFSINDADTFKAKLQSDIHTLITSANDLLSVSTQPITAVNLALSKTGLGQLSITETLGDILFDVGQQATASALGDDINNWVPQFLDQVIHGVFLLASDTDDNINNELANILSILGTSITEVYRLAAAARPGDQQGHERKSSIRAFLSLFLIECKDFGFMDGISQPALDGFNTPLPGQAQVPPGVIVLGADGDPHLDSRPDWVKDGSFLAFRQLQQFVPEFNKFLRDSAPTVPGLSTDESVDLLGARMVGRWKSVCIMSKLTFATRLLTPPLIQGAPVDLSPLHDDPVLAADPTRNNNFNFTHPGFNFTSDQTHCPFSAHIRKVAPRADFPAPEVIIVNHILRAGTPYGPEGNTVFRGSFPTYQNSFF